MLRIYPEVPQEKKPEFFLRLINHHGLTTLAIVDDKGVRVSSGSLLEINHDGTFRTCGSVSDSAAKSIGIQLTTNNSVLIVTY